VIRDIQPINDQEIDMSYSLSSGIIYIRYHEIYTFVELNLIPKITESFIISREIFQSLEKFTSSNTIHLGI